MRGVCLRRWSRGWTDADELSGVIAHRGHPLSSTNRGGKRTPSDFYPTPRWCVRRLLEGAELPGGRWLEPCVGHGAVVAATAGARSDVHWTGVDVQPEFADHVAGLGVPVDFHVSDFISWKPSAEREFDVVITNPPYSIAQGVIERSFELAPVVVMLLRLNYLASGGRAAFMRQYPPDVFVLPNRPSFSGRGTDSIEYAWFVWYPREERRAGRLSVLRPTAVSERRQEHSTQTSLIDSVSLRPLS